MAQLPEGYRISPDRVPVPGSNITEAVGIGDELSAELPKPGTLAYRFAEVALPELIAEIKGDDDVSTD